MIAEVGPCVFTSPDANLSLNDATLAELSVGPGRIVAVFDVAGDKPGCLPAGLVDPSHGIFSYNDLGNGVANFVVYDRYADTDQLDSMTTDQRTKFIQFQPAGGRSFLLSWTLTQKVPLGHPCILDLACGKRTLPSWGTSTSGPSTESFLERSSRT